MIGTPDWNKGGGGGGKLSVEVLIMVWSFSCLRGHSILGGQNWLFQRIPNIIFYFSFTDKKHNPLSPKTPIPAT